MTPSKAKKEIKEKPDKRVKKETKKTKKSQAVKPTKPKASKKATKAAVDKKAKSPKPSPRKEPKTMDELFKVMDYDLKGLKKGQVIKGTITEISRRHLLIDIGAKTEGIVTSKEFEFIRDYIKGLKEGDEVEVNVGSPENDKGQILLSLRRAAANHKWNLFSGYEKTGEPITVNG